MSNLPLDDLSIQSNAIRRRKQVRVVAIVLLVLLAGSSVLSHLMSPIDARALAGKRVKVIEILSCDVIRIRAETDIIEEVQLLGIAPPPEPWATATKQYLSSRLSDKDVVLQFDGTQVRTDDGKILALVYPTDNECINVSLVTFGHAFVDRRVRTFLESQFSQAESEARKKQRGFWADLKDEDQPAWRIEWIKKRFSTTTRPSS